MHGSGFLPLTFKGPEQGFGGWGGEGVETAKIESGKTLLPLLISLLTSYHAQNHKTT